MEKIDTREPMTVEEVADEVISQLDNQSIDQIRHYPSSTDMHFGLGLWIRNEYIHSGKMGPVFMADDVSSEITGIIASKALPEYADYPLAVSLFDWPRCAYVSAHRYYLDRDASKMVEAIHARYGALVEANRRLESIREKTDWPSGEHDVIWDTAYHEWSDARDAFIEHVIRDLFNEEPIDKLRGCGNGIVLSRIDDLIKLRDYLLEDENLHRSFFVPAEIGYLADSGLKGTKEWVQGKDALLWFIREIDYHPEAGLLPSWLFDDEEIALEALRINGNLIQFMGDRRSDASSAGIALRSAWPSYKFISEDLKEDREVLKAAFMCERCGTLLFEDFFRKYNDDDELVALALDSSGENLSWASERIRDDFDMVCLAIDNVRSTNNIYEDISERLRSDRRIVIRIANRSGAPWNFPPTEYKDDDEVGALLANTEVHGDHFSLIGMSRRIKEMYMTEDELSRWGDIGEGEDF